MNNKFKCFVFAVTVAVIVLENNYFICIKNDCDIQENSHLPEHQVFGKDEIIFNMASASNISGTVRLLPKI